MNILILEDDPTRLTELKRNLRTHQLSITDVVPVAIELLQKGTFDYIFLDHDLKEHHYGLTGGDPDKITDFDHEMGYAVAKWLALAPWASPKATIILHTLNKSGGIRMKRVLMQAGRRPIQMPFHAWLYAWGQGFAGI